MFQKKYFVLAALMMNLACSVSTDNGDDSGTASDVQGLGWPAYSTTGLSGKVFGNDWKAVHAVARANINNSEETIVELYSENLANACKSAVSSSAPYATVIIPKNYAVTEYVADMTSLSSGSGGGNPLVFTSLSSTAKNVMAEKTKLQITEIKPDGFQMSVYATATEQDGTVSEINGQVFVTDCAKAVDFAVWEQLAGWYKLKSFNGVETAPHTSILEIDTRDFYDVATQRSLRTLVFPLYRSVSSGSSVTMTFGPMQGLGSSTMTEQNGARTFTYSYHGPVRYSGQNITLNLDLTVVQKSGQLDVQYTIEIPNHIPSTQHQFVLSE